MIDLRYLNRHNVCEMSGVCCENGDTFYRDNRRYPCFRAAFDFVSRYAGRTYNITYKLHILKQPDQNGNNFAVLSKFDMMKLLNSVKHVIPFKYHFIEHPDDYVLKMSLTGTSLQHKGLLMLSRMLFEFPHNLCAADALHLKKMGRLGDVNLRHLTLINLYTLCISSVPYYSLDECIINGQLPEMISTKKLQKALRSRAVRNKKISKIIPGKMYQGLRFGSWGISVEEAFSEPRIKERFEIYSTNLKRNLNA